MFHNSRIIGLRADDLETYRLMPPRNRAVTFYNARAPNIVKGLFADFRLRLSSPYDFDFRTKSFLIGRDRLSCKGVGCCKSTRKQKRSLKVLQESVHKMAPY
ncbi:MAG: hypothetical protein CL680_15475 [Blastomonas sp.]|nr:hypothetical protein [Blastomonas sp.]